VGAANALHSIKDSAAGPSRGSNRPSKSVIAMHYAGGVAAKNAAATRAGVKAVSTGGRGKASLKVSPRVSSSGLRKMRRSRRKSSLYKPGNRPSSSASTQKAAAGAGAAGAGIVTSSVPNLKAPSRM
jgi:hypothetical protein